MTNPITRRRFFQTLAASCAAAGTLPVGFPSEAATLEFWVGDVRWHTLPGSNYTMYMMIYENFHRAGARVIAAPVSRSATFTWSP